MSYLVNLVRQRRTGLDGEVYVDTLRIDDEVKDAEKALRAAAKEFLATPNGKQEVKKTGNYFNWGDFVLTVPNDILAKHGIEFASSGVKDIVVDQDEVLCKEEEEYEN